MDIVVLVKEIHRHLRKKQCSNQKTDEKICRALDFNVCNVINAGENRNVPNASFDQL